MKALADLEAQRDRLAKQADELDDIVASLKKRLEEMNIELVAARDDAEAAEVASAEKLRALQAKAATNDKMTEDYLAQLKRAAALLDSLKADNRRLEDELTEAERRRQTELLEQAENNRELVGLRGSLRRVAIVIDASGSMKQAGPGGADRWAEAQKILATWLKHLNVEECVLVVYSSRVRTFPADGTFADLRGTGSPDDAQEAARSARHRGARRLDEHARRAEHGLPIQRGHDHPVFRRRPQPRRVRQIRRRARPADLRPLPPTPADADQRDRPRQLLRRRHVDVPAHSGQPDRRRLPRRIDGQRWQRYAKAERRSSRLFGMAVRQSSLPSNSSET